MGNHPGLPGPDYLRKDELTPDYLEDAADRLPGGRLEKQMKMVGHQAVAEERERIPCLGAGEIAKEHIPFVLGAEDIGSVVPAVDRVVNKVIACRSWKSSHESNLPT